MASEKHPPNIPFSTRGSRSAVLLRAAAAGYFPPPGPLPDGPLDIEAFARRPYTIRPARRLDLPQLELLEAHCWPEPLRADLSVLTARLAYASGQLVLVDGDTVRAVIYSQRIADPALLDGLTAEQVADLHSARGAVVQLLAVNVLPGRQDAGLGDQLLEFMLQYRGLQADVRAVVAVTRFKQFAEQATHDAAAYLAARDARDVPCDPILRFHHFHGATLVKLMPGYRPGDTENQGYGVLVHYDPRTRSPRTHTAEEPSTVLTRQALHDLLAGYIRALPTVADGYASDRPLLEMGLDSLDLQDLRAHIEEVMGASLSPTVFFDHPTVDAVTAYLSDTTLPTTSPISPDPLEPGPSEVPAHAMAILGCACRFPGGADTPERFWRLLHEGTGGIVPLPAARRRPGFDVGPGLTMGGYLEDIARFDAAFFRISPAEAELMDPQQRLLLECSRHALEDAGLNPDDTSGTTMGVFIGAAHYDYRTLADLGAVAGTAHGATGTAPAMLANRLSYLYDWHGPSLTLDTACSSSLVALHEAVRALRAGTCSRALVGGVNLICAPGTSAAYHAAGMLSPHARCKTFDASADGYVRGEGVAAVVLQPLHDARAARHTIRALVLGTAVNHGGRAGSLTAPNPSAQENLLRAALADARVAPESVTYLETHGTGTPLGDPVEVEGIVRAYVADCPTRPMLALGAVKTHIGHLEAAAGMAGLLQVLGAMQHRRLPAVRGFEQVNPYLPIEGKPVTVVTESRPWDVPAHLPRRAGVSSYGFGGAGAHAVLQEAPEQPAEAPVEAPDWVGLSAADNEALAAMVARLHAYLQEDAPAALHDIAHTLRVGRQLLACRWAVAVRDLEHLRAETARFPQAPQHAGVPELVAAAEAFTAGKPLPTPPSSARRVPLPGYPFAGDRHWLPAPADLHPLLGRNCSSLHGACFRTHWSETHVLFGDHRVANRCILPAAVCLETFVAALYAAGVSDTALLDVTWMRPLAGPGPLDLTCRLTPEGDTVRLSLALGDDDYVQGTAVRLAEAPADDPPPLPWAPAEPAETLYADLAGRGLVYGPAFRVVQQFSLTEDGMAATLQVPEEAPSSENFFTHPVLLDGALQAAVYLDAHLHGRLALPFTLGRYESGRVGNACRAEVRRAAGDHEAQSYHIVLRDAAGRIVARLQDVVLRASTRAAATTWLTRLDQPTPLPTHVLDGTLLLWDDDDRLETRLRDAHPRLHILRDGAELPRTRAARAARLEAVRPRYLLIRDPETHAAESGHTRLPLLQAAVGHAHPLSTLYVYASRAGAAVTGTAAVLQLEQVRTTLVTLHAADPTPDLVMLFAPGIPRAWRHGPLGYAVTTHVAQKPPLQTGPAFKQGGVYLLTGGRGGLGRALTTYLTDTYAARLVVLGRGEIAASSSPDIVHLRGDVCVAVDVGAAVAEAQARFGGLDGVIHAAGVLQDQLFSRSNAAAWDAVLAPKILGLHHLHSALADVRPAWVLLCSSVTARAGNIGQAAYAYANAYLDAFAADHGAPYISVALPPLLGAGMALDADTLHAHFQARGLEACDVADVPALLETAATLGTPCPWPCHGRATRVLHDLAALSPGIEAPAPKAAGAADRAVLLTHLRTQFGTLAKQPPARILADEDLDVYGIDSFMATAFTRKLEATFGPLPKTLLFEYRSLDALADHLAAVVPDRVAALSPTDAPAPALHAEPPVPELPTRVAATRPAPKPAASEAVAVIGLFGRYPQASNPERFWQNLLAGRDCIEEIPAARWDWHRYYHPTRRKGMAVNKWGGFLDDVDRFDAAFFHISPREANLMDPQERLFLETVWNTLEDGGYSRAALKGRPVGVYVGVMYGQYQLFGAEETQKGNVLSTTSWYASIANRVSYFFDWHGPSMALDTMCSSSLTAVHLARHSLLRGETSLAIAGGVNLSLHPDKDLRLSQGGFAAADGRCKSFGEGGDGYVPGEGVGAVLLKRLSEAVADGDAVYGVIHASAVNHGGKTNGYTVPNPTAQGDLIAACLREAGVHPHDVSYVEAHGTGTTLGDPIEIAGLTRAFQTAADGDLHKGYCAIGSAKSNIGHLEAAAGIAGLTKVLLQLQHRTLVPSLHSETLNPHIDFAATPFQVQREVAPWTVPRRPDTGTALPRMAGLSSFGAGGAGAHLIVGEYVAPVAPRPADAVRLFPLSAGDAPALQRRVADLIAFLDAHPDTDAAALAATLQTGREALAHRLTIVAAHTAELRTRLDGFLMGQRDPACVQGVVRPEDFVQVPPDTATPEEQAAAWVRGARITWPARPVGLRTCRLPTYPFAGDRHWFSATEAVVAVAAPHPLLDHNTSTLSQFRFSKSLPAGGGSFGDHRLHARPVLPAAALPEMARAAGALVGEAQVIGLYRLTWLRPVYLDDETTLELSLTPEPRGLQVALAPAGARGAFARCGLAWATHLPEAPLWPEDDRHAYTRGADTSALYARLADRGLPYGPRYRTLERVETQDDTAYATLLTADAADGCLLSPRLLDGAFQACLSLLPDEGGPWVPTTLASLQFFAGADQPRYVRVTRTIHAAGEACFDLALYDASGRAPVTVEGLCLQHTSATPGFLYRPQWRRAAAALVSGGVSRAVVAALPHSDLHDAAAQARIWQAPAPYPTHDAGTIAALVAAIQNTGADTLVCHAVLPTPDTPNWLAAADAATTACLHLLQALHRADVLRHGLQLVLLTRGLYAVADQDAVNPAAGALPGLLRTVAGEYPRCRVRCIDLPAVPTPDDDQTAPAVVDNEGAFDLAVRAGRTYTRGLAVHDLPLGTDLPLRPGGTYLILGGAGGIGTETAVWLARRTGATCVLVGRSPLDEARARNLERITAAGGRWRYWAADGADAAAMQTVVREATAAFGPIRGVVHSAIVLADRTLARMDDAEFAAAFRPKAHAAVVLAEVCRDQPLDFLLFYSSFQSFWGNSGQANYAAGCTFKDAWSAYLQTRMACPVQVINWGYWDEVGIVAGDQYRRELARMGIRPIKVPEGMDVLARVLANGAPQTVAVKADAAVLARAGLPRTQEAASVTEPSDPLRRQLAGQTLLERYAAARLETVMPAVDRIVPRYARLAAAIDTLRRTPVGAEEAPALARRLATDHPELAAHLRLLDTCLDALPQVLSGERPATEVVFPNGSQHLVEGIYRGTPVADHFQRLTAARVVQAARALHTARPDQPVQLLEIGAGTGGTTAFVLEALEADGVPHVYTYTDVSLGFTKAGKRRFAQTRPGMVFQTLDIEADPVGQGYPQAGYDLVLGANVVHATRRLARTLTHIRTLLRRDGVLLLNEVTTFQAFTCLTFGLLEGWWLFEDDTRRIAHTPLLSPAQWRSLLEEEGFHTVHTDTGPSGLDAGQAVVTAHNAAPVAAEAVPLPAAPARAPMAPDADAHRAAVAAWLGGIFAEVLELPAERFDEAAPWSEYGVDSILTMEAQQHMEAVTGTLPATLLFEYPTLGKLTDYFLAQHGPALHRAQKLPAEAPSAIATHTAAPTAPVAERHNEPAPPAAAAVAAAEPKPGRNTADAVAVIGLSCRLPQAPDLDHLWQVLHEGRQCITTLPEDRWDAGLYADDRVGGIYTQWGGFLQDIDCFDAAFFHILPREADAMDPQERLFLQGAWHALEDAAVSRADLAAAGPVGVFAAVMNSGYARLAGRPAPGDARAETVTSYWSLANRVSYCFDLTGPSMAVDTACAGGLTALHLAVESLRRGQCTAAFVGAVNLIVHPSQLQKLAAMQMLSPGPACKAFGEGADGFVDAEGLVVLLLKPLADALRDGDPIRGVLRGTAVNHGGKSSGFHVPSPKQQAAVIRAALADAGAQPADLTYIEGHGTGTSLGDPIEVAALNEVFAGVPGPVFLGSVKSNIGHTEATSGLAGIAKVLLQFAHRTLVPTLHAEQPNPKIAFADGPLRPATAATPWPSATGPLCAGVSAFGAGGSNGHVVLQAPPVRHDRTSPERPAYLATVSAPTRAALERRLDVLTAYLDRADAPADLGAVCRTLNLGRDHFEVRCALIVSSSAQLREALHQARRGSHGGMVLLSDAQAVPAAEAPVFRKMLHTLMDDLFAPSQASAYRDNLAALADLYVRGYMPDWRRLHREEPPSRVPLPSYPFARTRHWLPAAEDTSPHTPTNDLHPLLDHNLSGFHRIAFAKRFRPDDVYAAAHRLQGQPTLPATAVLEMARAAAAQADGRPVTALHDLLWHAPLTIAAPVAVELVLEACPDGASFHLTGAEGTHAEGRLSFGPVTAPGAPQATPTDATWQEGHALYADLRRMGLEHGPAYQGLVRVRCGPTHAEAECRLPDAAPRDTRLVLHPMAWDCVLQSAALLLGDKADLLVPHALTKLAQFAPLPDHFQVRANLVARNADSLTADLLVWQGSQVYAHVQGLRLSRLNREGAPASSALLFRRVSSPAPPPASGRPQRLLVLDDGPHRFAQLRATLPGDTTVIRLHTARPPQDDDASCRLLDLQAADPFAFLDTLPPSAHTAVLNLLPLGETEASSGLAPVLMHDLARALAARERDAVTVVHVCRAGRGSAPAAYGRTLVLEAPHLTFRTVEVDPAAVRLTDLVAETTADGSAHVCLSAEGRTQWTLEPVALPPAATPPLRRGAVVLISGGAGGLGRLFAQHLVTRYAATVVLVGRSAPDAALETFLASLRRAGGKAEYVSADLTRAEAAAAVVAHTRTTYGALHGVIHAAGCTHDGLVRHTDQAALTEVWNAKCLGALHLDAALGDAPCDFFACCASIAAVVGNVGQAPYAAANGFLEDFAAARAASGRPGRTVSLIWPQWQADGMQVPESVTRRLATDYGLQPLTPTQGLSALEAALALDESVVLVAVGDRKRLTAGLCRPPEAAPAMAAPAHLDDTLLENAVVDVLTDVLRLPREDLRPHKTFDDYGINSLVKTELVHALEHRFGPLPKTLFFEHHTLTELLAWFREHRPTAATPPIRQAAPAQPAPPASVTPEPVAPSVPSPQPSPDPVAVIGLAGRYPAADDPAAFWHNLSAGLDCVTEVPADRWHHGSYYRADDDAPGYTRTAHGGFLREVQRFDALFFNISPDEAAHTDPQTRLFLETAWACMEDAGYTRERLRSRHVGKMGVYAAAMWSEYQLYGMQGDGADRRSLGGSSAAIANRVSTFLDARGPSLTLDTMCSSALTGMDLACRALRDGTCEVALVGGVNLNLHPNKFLLLDQMQLSSHTGRCRGFGADADGYVPGEGVGAVLLKPLSAALADRDAIRGLIRATGANHAGKSGGYMVPSPSAQLHLLREVLTAAAVPVETIGYMEASAVGSEMGDAVEIVAAAKAISGFSTHTGTCALGTVKSNIGHLEAASGMAALTKVLLMMQHKTLVPTLHAAKSNPNIAFADTPFHLQRRLGPWPSPVLEGREHPRRALVNAFGAGGSNAALILEAFTPESEPMETDGKPYLIVLSAHSGDRLAARAAGLARYLAECREKPCLRALAYSLQVGREAMAERIAFTAADIAGVEDRLERIAHGHGSYYRGSTENQANKMILDQIGDEVVAGIIASGDLDKVGRLWVCGLTVTWSQLYTGPLPRMLNLPTYPFGGGTHWPDAAALPRELVWQPHDDPAARRTVPEAVEEDHTWLAELVAGLLSMPVEDLNLNRHLAEYGFGSLYALRLLRRLDTDQELSPRLLLQYPSVTALGRRLKDLGIGPRPAPSATIPHQTPQRPRPFPLSEGQKGLWSLYFQQPETAAYNLPIALSWPSPVNRDHLAEALTATLTAHPMPAARFKLEAQGLVQTYDISGTAHIQCKHLDGADAQALRAAVLAEASRPFDLLREVPYRAVCFSCRGHRDIFLFVVHHLVFDGVSLPLFLQRLQQAYADAQTGRAASPMPPAIGFDHFVQWEQAYLAGPRAEADLGYWLGRLHDCRFSQTLPLGKQPCDGPPSGEIHETRLPAATVLALQQLAVAQQRSFNSLCLTAWFALLHASGMGDDLVTGMPADIRPEASYEQVVGFFVNMLPMRATPGAHTTYANLLNEVADAMLDALEHPAYPLHRLAAQINRDHDAPRPLFHTAYYFQSWHRQPRTASSDPASPELIPWVHQTGEYPLTLEVYEEADGCRLLWKYDRRLYAADEIAGLAADYARSAAAMADHLAGPLPRRQMQQTPTSIAPAATLPAMFLEQVARTPDATAVIGDDARLTYADLARRSARLSAGLARRGIGRGALVALMVDRTADMVVGLLGILRAGAAYVPLDPDYPRARIAYILEDAGVDLLLVDSSVTDTYDVPTLRLAEAGSTEPIPEPTIETQDLAYVIYTSGSTGKPKGVEVDHLALGHFLTCMKDQPGCGPDDHVLAMTTLCFDISALEVYLPLVSGARVEVVPTSVCRDGLALRRRLETSGATLVQATPAGWDMLLNAGLQRIPGLKILCGGEAWDETLAKKLLAVGDAVWNMFGPTETTIWSSIYRVGPDGKVRLGTPIGDTRFWVLDEAMRPVARGEVGELYIGGSGVARGYRNRPDLTRERFLPHPLEKQRIIYKTGDLVRYV